MSEPVCTYGTQGRRVPVLAEAFQDTTGRHCWEVTVPVWDFAKEIRAGEAVDLEVSDPDFVVSEGTSYRGGLEPTYGDNPLKKEPMLACSFLLTRKEVETA